MWSRQSPSLSRWNSFSSATSGHTGLLSVMDIFSLRNDDPEELLLDLGFGCDEPDLSGRIPARFINHQSQARGINLRVFLEAQKNRIDLENPDVSNRFKQLEVLQQVTTAFSSMVGSSSSASRAQEGKDMSPEVRERRRRMGTLFRRALKKSVSQIHYNKTQDLITPAATSTPCDKPGLQENVYPLAEEQGGGPDPQAQPHVALTVKEVAHRPWALMEGHPLTANAFLQRRRSPGQVRESFEMEEIHSFDENCVTRSYAEEAVNLVQGVIRTNSCQSDSSGFLEELFISSLSQQVSPGSDLIKAPSGLSEGITDSQSSGRPGSQFFHTSPSLLLSSFLTSPGADKSLLSLAFDPSPSSVSKSDLQSSKPDHDQCPPASLRALACENLSPCSSLTELQNITYFQSLTLPSPASFTSVSSTSSPMQPASLITGSKKIKTEDKDAPSPHLSTLSHCSNGTACSTFSSAPPASPPSLSPNLDYPFSASIAMSSTQSHSSSGSAGNTQSEWTEAALHENSFSAYGVSSFLLPSSLYLPPYTTPDFHCPSSLPSPPLIESFSQSPENNQENNQTDFFFPGPGGIGPLESPTNTHKKEEEIPSSLSFQLDKDNPLAQPSLILDSSKFKKGCSTMLWLSPNTSIPLCQSALSSQLHDPDGLIDPAVGGISDLTEQSISQQDRSCSHNNNTYPAQASPVQDVIRVKMDHLSLDTEDTLHMNGKGEVEVEKCTDTVKTQESVVYNSDTKSSASMTEGSGLVSKEVCNQTEILSCTLPKVSPETKLKDLRKVCQMEINGMESEPGSYLFLHDDIPETLGRADVEPKDLIEIDSLDLVLVTSVDSSEGENGDVDTFFQQLDTEGQIYWAEPVQVSNPTPVLEDPGLDSFSSAGMDMPLSLSCSTVVTDQTSRNATASTDTPSSLTLAPFPSPSAIPDLKPSSCSVSVQMSSPLTSHIVHRKDIPYMTDSKRILLPGVLPLDTSTPFRAVQSWTDLQIERNTLNKKLSYEALHTGPNKLTFYMSASEMIQRPTLNSSSPSFPLPSNDEQSHDCLPGMARNYRTVSVYVDKGLQLDEEEEVDRNRNEGEEKIWEGNQRVTMTCHCTSDHQCTYCTQKSNNKQHALGNIPYSLDELEEMMLCLQQFCTVLGNMEEQLSEEQAAVYSVLSDQDREKFRDIEELRQAVKQQAGELEMQLNELAHHYDDSLKMKMHRLLDEQSLLCSQLRVFLPGRVPTSLSATPNRTVATQCCLLPWIPLADVQSGHVSSWSTWDVDSPRHSPPGSESIREGPSYSTNKADKLDIVSFLQRLKESLRHSVNTDSLGKKVSGVQHETASD